jgi:hypothetical protein
LYLAHQRIPVSLDGPVAEMRILSPVNLALGSPRNSTIDVTVRHLHVGAVGFALSLRWRLPWQRNKDNWDWMSVGWRI